MSGLKNNPILHVVVVGFHHKKGCQVDYSYPPLIKGQPYDSSELPVCWKHLPSLALPDGAHNCEKETIYFHLPSLDNPRQTVYGISCYRQMNAEMLINRSLDVTRGTVQKSVCVLSYLPLYGLIQAKLELITHAYFDERDFSKVALLEETYKNLNSLLTPDLVWGTQVFLGLPARDLILTFKHKTLLLFKLLLLERKVLFYNTGVKDLCSVVLTLCSLFPGMIEKGLEESASVSLRRLSPDLRTIQEGDYLEVHYEESETEPVSVHDLGFCKNIAEEVENQKNVVKAKSVERESSSLHLVSPDYSNATKLSSKKEILETHEKQKFSDDHNLTSHLVESQNVEVKIEPKFKECNIKAIPKDLDNIDETCNSKNEEQVGDYSIIQSKVQQTLGVHKSNVTVNEEENGNLLREIEEALASMSVTHSTNSRFSSHESGHEGYKVPFSLCGSEGDSNDKTYGNEKTVISSSLSYSQDVPKEDYMSVNNENSLLDEELKKNVYKSMSLTSVLSLELDSCGLPLEIFKKGALCHPYLSLPFLDLLTNVNIRNFVVGANNVLFRQKKHLFDVLVEIEDSRIDIFDAELRKQLHLTTEDLRFADYLVRHVSDESSDIFLDGTGWEGGEEWVRTQFKLYLLSLLRTTQSEDCGKEAEEFNSSFVMAWKTTHNYKMWKSGNYLGILEVNPVHPFHGQLNVGDMRLRLAHTMQNSEKGRRLNQAVMSTGKAVVQTSRVFGGAWTSAKSMMSSWWSNFGSSSQYNIPSSAKSQTYPELDLVVNSGHDELQHLKDINPMLQDVASESESGHSSDIEGNKTCGNHSELKCKEKKHV
ncbi:late secretory pathway protein AVL9 homolog [Limulus polyphemus]|uniref:Late secretory pathway protein AVL9 homolog n=1 Tax=Limulus polyphemus TaxID=6850 RepID=A0ABM1C3L5_LIMPO|nr:late secretory pathway protein AVL9 homolog [Limulus polyphemus]